MTGLTGSGEVRFILVPADYTATRRFYEDGLGLAVMADFEEDSGVLFSLGGNAVLELLADGDVNHEPRRIGIQVASIDEAYRLAVSTGAEVGEPQDQPWGHRSVDVVDPGGNQITFFEVVD